MVTTGDTYAGIPSGFYSVTVTDINGCSASAGAAVSDNAGPMLTLSNVIDASCSGACDGSVDIVINDGSPVYQISVTPPPCGTTNPIFIGINSGENLTISGLAEGTHSITIVDATGCMVSGNTTIGVTTALDNSVTVTNGNLTANLSGASYQWIDCDNGNTPVVNATNQSFAPPSNGNYAVELMLGNCTNTSICNYLSTVGIASKSISNNVVIYPNPTSGAFTIDLGNTQSKTTVVITDILGNKISESTHQNSDKIDLQLNAESGTYLISIKSDDGVSTQRLVKE